MSTALFVKDVTIAASASITDAFSLAGEFCIVGIIMPATWTAASLTFQISMDQLRMRPTEDAAGNFVNVYDDSGNEVTVSAAASRALMLSQNVLIAGNHFKIRSGTAGAAVNQAADRTLKVIFRKVG